MSTYDAMLDRQASKHCESGDLPSWAEPTLQDWSEDETKMRDFLASGDLVPPAAVLAKLISSRNGSDEQLEAIAELRTFLRNEFCSDDQNIADAIDCAAEESRQDAMCGGEY